MLQLVCSTFIKEIRLKKLSMLYNNCDTTFCSRFTVDVFANTTPQGTTVSSVKTSTMTPPGGQGEKQTQMFAEVSILGQTIDRSTHNFKLAQLISILTLCSSLPQLYRQHTLSQYG